MSHPYPPACAEGSERLDPPVLVTIALPSSPQAPQNRRAERNRCPQLPPVNHPRPWAPHASQVSGQRPYAFDASRCCVVSRMGPHAPGPSKMGNS